MRNPNLYSFFFASLLLSSLSIFITCNASEVAEEHPFSYIQETEKGPEEWGNLNSSWKLCEMGKLQSPIDLREQNVQVFEQLGKLGRVYKPAPATLRHRGHDIAMVWKGDAGEITINNTTYKLLQCHWHSPSEHTVNGKRYDMELHVVHSNSNGDKAVVGVLYNIGEPDPLLTKLIDHFKNVDKEGMDLGIVNPRIIKFKNRSYYRYMGSLTTPPCSEGVIWSVIKNANTVSREQVAALKEAFQEGFEDNARPVQRLFGRSVFLYNFIGENQASDEI